MDNSGKKTTQLPNILKKKNEKKYIAYKGALKNVSYLFKTYKKMPFSTNKNKY